MKSSQILSISSIQALRRINRLTILSANVAVPFASPNGWQPGKAWSRGPAKLSRSQAFAPLHARHAKSRLQ